MDDVGIYCEPCMEQSNKWKAGERYHVIGGLASIDVRLCFDHANELIEDHPRWKVILAKAPDAPAQA